MARPLLLRSGGSFILSRPRQQSGSRRIRLATLHKSARKFWFCGKVVLTCGSLSINALRACVSYIYIRPLGSFRASKLGLIDLTVANTGLVARYRSDSFLDHPPLHQLNYDLAVLFSLKPEWITCVATCHIRYISLSLC